MERIQSAIRADRDGGARTARAVVGLRRRPMGLQLSARARQHHRSRHKRNLAQHRRRKSSGVTEELLKWWLVVGGWWLACATTDHQPPATSHQPPQKPWISISTKRKNCFNNRRAISSRVNASR